MKHNVYGFLSAGAAALATLPAGTAQAVPIFQSNEVTLNMQGYFTAHQINIDGNTTMEDGASRLGFTLDVPAYHKWDVGFDVEWGLRAISPGQAVIIQGDQQAAAGQQEDPFYIRLGNAFAKHDHWGDFRAGKQWSVYYDVSQITDWFRISGGLASGTYALNSDGGVTGTGRADGAFTWRKRFKGLGGKFQVGLQYAAHVADLDIRVEDVAGPDTLLVCPPRDCEYGINQGISITYNLDVGDGLFLGAAYSRVKLDINTTRGEVFDISNPARPVLINDRRRISASSNDFVLGVGASYGKGPYDQGFYGAVVAQRSHNNELAPEGSTRGASNFFNALGSESFFSYTWGAFNCYSIYWGHNLLESHDDKIFEEALITGSKYRLAKYFLGFNYRWNKRVNVYFEGAQDDSNEVAQELGSFLAAGIRIDI